MAHLLILAVWLVGPAAPASRSTRHPPTGQHRRRPENGKRRNPPSKQERGMNTRLDDPTATTDPLVRGVVIMTLAVTTLGMVLLLRAAVGGRVDHLTVRVHNQAGLAVQVDALDASGNRASLGEAGPGTLTTFQEIPDIGPRWTLVAAYGGQQVHRQTLTKAELAARNWTVSTPASATSALQRAGFQ
jgi:hypothetical protein